MVETEKPAKKIRSQDGSGEHDFVRRRPFVWVRNGKFTEGYFAINIKAWAAVFGGLGLILSTTWVAGVFVFGPRIENTINKAIDTKLAPFMARIAGMEDEMRRTRTEMADTRAVMRRTAAARYTLIDAKLHAARLRASNPRLIVPEPEHTPLPGEGEE